MENQEIPIPKSRLRAIFRRLARLERLSSTDGLTGLLNRRQLEHEVGRLKRAFSQGRGRATLAVMLDLRGFKAANRRGHLEGDRVLVDFARQLRESVKSKDVVARFGGDEFFVLLRNYKDDGSGIAKVRARLEGPWLV